MSRIKILFLIMIGLAVLTVTVAAERPTVIMTFDDGWLSVSEKAYPIMQNNGQKGVAFVNIDPIIGGYTAYMKQPELNTLYGAGWDISSHTYSHKVLTTVNSATLNSELSTSKIWLDTNGYPRGAMFLAYPEGAYNPGVIAAAQSNNYVAARTVDPPTAGYPHYTLGSSNIFELDSFETIGGTDDDTTVINQINNTIAANGLLILSFHKIVDTLSSTGFETEFKTSDFQNVSNYLQSRSSEVDVRTLSEYFEVLPLPTYMPPTPINKTLGGSNNLSWTKGVGNGTDYFNYNANGTWQNESTATFYNVTGSIPGIYTVKVYAVNSTNGRTLNNLPLILNSIISETPTPSPTPSPTPNSTPTSTPTPTPTSSSGGSSGSSGGSSSGGSSGDSGTSGEIFLNIIVKEKYDIYIYNNKTTSIAFNHPDNPIMYIDITGNINAGAVTTSVEVLKDTSSLAKDPAPGKVNMNVNIWVGTSGFANPNNIKEAVIKFRVDNSWISSNNIKSSNIKMVRWDGSKWNALETAEKTKDNKYTYLEAKTNAFSPFAIIGFEDSGSSIIKKETYQSEATEIAAGTPQVNATASSNTSSDTSSEGAPPIDLAIIIVVFTYIAVVIAIHLKKKYK